MRAFQLPPKPRTWQVNDRIVEETMVLVPKGISGFSIQSEAGWKVMPGRTRRERRRAFFALKKKDRPD